MFGKMPNRGVSDLRQFAAPGVLIATRRHDWEVDEHGWIGPVLVETDEWVVAADASLYYLGDLRRQLSRHFDLPRDAPFGDLIVASLRGWGAHFGRYVEGDYAIIAWHRQSGRVLIAKDFPGRRSLATALTADGTLVVASSPRAVVEFPGVSRALDCDFIGASAAGLMGHGNGTGFADVMAVPGGTTIMFENGSLREVSRVQPPPFSSDWESEPSDRAAAQLRHLLEEAVLERVPQSGTAVVWMSGGWDSTSVFAAGQAGLASHPKLAARLVPVSMKYPPGDRGHEDAFVDAVAGRWNVPVRWLPVDEIALLDDAERRIRVRDDPRVQPFESQVRAMSRVSRELGARNVLDGAGGDHLFSVSSGAVMADHLRAGRFGPLRGEWTAWGHGSPRTFARACLLPLLPQDALEWIGVIRGRPIRGFWDAELPPWIVPSEGIVEQTRPEFLRDPTEGISAWETRHALTMPLVTRAMGWNHTIALEEGIVLRSPLFDFRVLTFAASRPLSDRSGGSDSKVLLRRAMAGLIPPEVLAPRGRKTGLPIDYFRRQFQSAGVRLLREFFGNGTKPHLERLGIVDSARLRVAIDEYERTGTHALGALLHLTLEAERWLASPLGPA
jgi:asparagine synthase (glutamine-hydrolysing)